MSSRPPSSYKVLLASNELAEIREALLAIDPTIEEDQQLFADSLEGVGADPLLVIEHLIEASIEAEALAKSAGARLAALAERKARFERRHATYRAGALLVLDRINLRKLERPAWTASLIDLPGRVIITDESALDDCYIRVTQKPDKDAIAADLKCGKTVRGAELSSGGIGLTIRTK